MLPRNQIGLDMNICFASKNAMLNNNKLIENVGKKFNLIGWKISFLISFGNLIIFSM